MACSARPHAASSTRRSPTAITGMGKEMLLWSKRWFEAAGFPVLYGDTDSLFVRSRERRSRSARANRPRQLAAALNAELARHIEARWRVQSRLELEFEKLYLRLFLPHARHSTRGASKRYAGLLHDARRGQRSSSSAWKSCAATGLRLPSAFSASSISACSPISPSMRTSRRSSGACAGASWTRSSSITRTCANNTGDYTATTPPHVAAARKSSQPPGRSIRYVVTTAGAEPLDNLKHPLDREHYVAKQVKPVAEPVLETLGLDFERVIGDTRQFDLLSP